MRVISAESAGFCRGVRSAVDKAKALAAGDHCIYTDGPLIHNDQMLARLREEGVIEMTDPTTLGRDVLLVRAHGIPPDRRLMLQKLGARIVDCTCPDVARIQGIIRKHARQGYSIVVFGDPAHAEVTGLLGFAEGRGHVVSLLEDVENLPEMDKVCAVSQSTQLPSEYERIAVTICEKYPEALVMDTICASTKNRVEDLVSLAKRVDALVIVGGEHSANTLHLVDLARTLAPTFHIQTASQLEEQLFRTFDTIGLTAGASTPAFVLEEVKNALASMEPHAGRAT